MLENTKYQRVQEHFQLIYLDRQGKVLESCETLLPIRSTVQGSFFHAFPALSPHERIALQLEAGQGIYLQEVVLSIGKRSLWTDLRLTRVGEKENTTESFWEVFIEDRTDFYQEWQEKQAAERQRSEGKNLELLNQILGLKQEVQRLEKDGERAQKLAYDTFWALWQERTAPLFALYEHTEVNITEWLDWQQQQLEYHLKAQLTAPQSIFFPAEQIGLLQRVWQAWESLNELPSSRWELPEAPENLLWYGRQKSWTLTLVAVFGELLRRRVPLRRFQLDWDGRQCTVIWEGDFIEPLKPLIGWLPEGSLQQNETEIFFQESFQVPETLPRVVLQASPRQHNQQVAHWLKQGAKSFLWQQNWEENQENTANFDLLVCQKKENTYISRPFFRSVWQWEPKEEPLRRHTVQACLHSSKPRINMIPKQALDLSYIREIVDNQPEMMLNLLSILEKNLQEYPEKMQQEWERGDLKALRESAHKFKSCTAYTNLDAFNEALSVIESSEENGISSQELKAQLEAVVLRSEDILEQIRQSMREIQ